MSNIPNITDCNPEWPRHANGTIKLLTEMTLSERRACMTPVLQGMLDRGQLEKPALPSLRDAFGFEPAQKPCEHDYSYAVYPAGKCRKCGACD